MKPVHPSNFSEPLRREVELEAALSLVLEFHSATPWTPERTEAWRTITGTDEVTTRAMCDHIRKVLGGES